MSKQTSRKQSTGKQAARKETAREQTARKQASDGRVPAPAPAPAPEAAGSPTTDLSRRRLLGTVGAAGAAGLVVGGAGGAFGVSAMRDEAPEALTGIGSTRVAFRAAGGGHQAGITTPLQATGHLVAFDLAPGTDRKAAAALLRRWSRTAEELMAGRAPDADTGVALDAGPSSLTITFGFGHGFFGRTGLTKRRPRSSTRCPTSPPTPWTRTAATAICGSRSAPMTRWSPSTRCARSRRTRPGGRGCAGR